MKVRPIYWVELVKTIKKTAHKPSTKINYKRYDFSRMGPYSSLVVYLDNNLSFEINDLFGYIKIGEYIYHIKNENREEFTKLSEYIYNLYKTRIGRESKYRDQVSIEKYNKIVCKMRANENKHAQTLVK